MTYDKKRGHKTDWDANRDAIGDASGLGFEPSRYSLVQPISEVQLSLS